MRFLKPKGIVIVNKWLTPPLASGIAIYPFIFLKSSKYVKKSVIVHERIHLRQQAELLVLPFYLLYFLNGVINLLSAAKPDFYRTILFEKEAFANESDSKYLLTRKAFAWTKYFGVPYNRPK